MFELATGTIDVWEKGILNKNSLERMLTSPDKKSALLVLHETDLGELASQTNDIEEIFEKDLLNLKNRISSVLFDRELDIIPYLFLGFDAWNIKLALKKKFIDKNISQDALSCSIMPFDILLNWIDALEGLEEGLFLKKKEVSSLEWPFEVLKKSLECVKEVADFSPSKIEQSVDRAYFKVKKIIAKSISKELDYFIRLEVDVANIKACLDNNICSGFLEGGNLTPQEIEKLIAGEMNGVGKSIDKFLQLFELSFLMKKISDSKVESSLEQSLQNFFTSKVIEKERAEGSGLSKVLAFFYKKINSHFNIRIILFSKDNNWPVEKVENILMPL